MDDIEKVAYLKEHKR